MPRASSSEAGSFPEVVGVRPPEADGKTIVARNRPEHFTSTAGDDTISGRGGTDCIDGLNGADKLLGSAGKNRLLGRDRDEILKGGKGWLRSQAAGATTRWPAGTSPISLRCIMPKRQLQSIRRLNLRLGLLAILVALLVGIVGPIVAAIYVASNEATKIEAGQMLERARDLLRRSALTHQEIDAAISALVGLDSPDPCSPASLERMRELDLASSNIQTVGHVVGDNLICSSFGTMPHDVQLGPVDLVRPNGQKVRVNVVFPHLEGLTFVAVERDGFVAIVHKDGPIEAVSPADAVSLALFPEGSSGPSVSRGEIKPEWLDRLNGHREVTFTDDTHVVALVVAADGHVAALAASPKANLDRHAREIGAVALPLGGVAALGLGFAVAYLARTQLALPAAIRSGLRRGEFFAVYQPIVELATGRWAGAEALIRWRRPGGELVRPDIFIPIAEEAGLIEYITRYMTVLISKEAGELFADNPGFYISLNLSSACLHSEGTVALLASLADALDAKPGNLMIEATERSFTDPHRANSVIEQIRALGVKVAIDDFGTGFSNLASLGTLKADYLKIDKSFVDTIGSDTATSQVILHIIDMAKSLQLQMVAEGVESDTQVEFLKSHGVQFAQGYFFARPMPMSEIRARL